MEFSASFPLTGAKRKTATLTNEPQKKPKISCSATAPVTHDGNENEGDDEAECYEVVEDEDEDEYEDGDGQDGNEDKQQHEENKNEEQSGKAKEYPANQQACAHACEGCDRIKLHDLQIRSLRDSNARFKESVQVEQQARMGLQVHCADLTQKVQVLQEDIRKQEEKTRRYREITKKCMMRLDALEKKK